MKRFISKVLPLIIAAVIAGCRSGGGRDSLVTIAEEYAARQGWEVARYKIETDSNDRDELVVYFTGKDMRPGNHFTVHINKTTHRCTLVEGA